MNPLEQLREPLAAAYGYTELLISQPFEEQERLELLVSVMRQLETMKHIINTQQGLLPEGE